MIKYISLFLITASLLHSQDTLSYRTDEIIITSSVSPVSFSNISRTVDLITGDEIEAAAGSSINELLQFSTGVDLRQRGVEGIQSDIGIRGGTFEQTLILINGVKIIDPQTGHHNMNLPLTPNDVSRIEILKGQGSRVFGANAFAGVVNIITKSDFKNSLSASLQYGSHGYFRQSVDASFAFAGFTNNLSFDRSLSDGYIHNTDFANISFSYRSSLKTKAGSINLFAGYNDKDFGANGFYSNLFPNQYEYTTTKFVNLSGELGDKNFYVSPKVYWRRNDDEFLLDYNDPGFYRNVHQTDLYGFEFTSMLQTSLGKTSFGGDFSKDEMISSNLGNRGRERKGFFVEHQFEPITSMNVNAGTFIYKYDDLDWKIWPGIDLSYGFSEAFRLYASYGQAFRIPTFTELYYTSPANIGNPDLESEQTVNYELGFYYDIKTLLINGALFLKDGKNIIDWARRSSDEAWQVRNIADVTTTGFEISVDYYLSGEIITKISAAYTYLNSDKNIESLESRYLLEHLRHQTVLIINNRLPFEINQFWSLRLEDRVNDDNYFIADTKLARVIDNFTLSLSATNLFNSDYSDVSGVPLPGIWIKAGLKYQLNDL